MRRRNETTNSQDLSRHQAPPFLQDEILHKDVAPQPYGDGDISTGDNTGSMPAPLAPWQCSETASRYQEPQEGHDHCITVHHLENWRSLGERSSMSPSSASFHPAASLSATLRASSVAKVMQLTVAGGKGLGVINRLDGAMRQASPYTLGLLLTGCSLALLSQHMANQGMIMNKAQLPAWTRYTLNFLISLMVEFVTGLAVWSLSGQQRTSATTQSGMSMKQAVVLSIIGLFDVLGYVLNSMGFAKTGAALSMVLGAACGQICTAMIRWLILHKPLTARQITALFVVTAGLVIRSLGAINWAAPHTTRLDARAMSGMVFIVLGMLSYAVVGVGYEHLVNGMPLEHPLTQAQINRQISLSGALAITVYQVVYTWPRREELIFQKIRESGMAVSEVVKLYIAFGALYTLHSFVQGKVLGCHGSVSLGVINAMRAVVVTAGSAAIFCRHGSSVATSQCLTLASGASAVVVTSGALMWATAPNALPRRDKQE